MQQGFIVAKLQRFSHNRHESGDYIICIGLINE